MLDKTKVNKVLVITLSNIGDVVLTTPVLSALRNNFPQAKIDIVVGPRAAPLFHGDPRINRLIVYDKGERLGVKVRLVSALRKNRYDLVVDLRHSMIPLFLGAKASRRHCERAHKKDAHLLQLKELGIDTAGANFDIYIPKEEEENAARLLGGISGSFVVIAPGARSDTKRWSEDKFAELVRRLIDTAIDSNRNIVGANNYSPLLVLVGDSNDEKISKEIADANQGKPLDLCGKTTLTELAAILKRAKVVVSNDSAAMHVAAAVGTPVIAIFGPTDPMKYGPRGERSLVIRKALDCSPCEKAQCSRNRVPRTSAIVRGECMELITVDEVYKAVVGALCRGGSRTAPTYS